MTPARKASAAFCEDRGAGTVRSKQTAEKKTIKAQNPAGMSPNDL
jgi:hypothetical protein